MNNKIKLWFLLILSTFAIFVSYILYKDIQNEKAKIPQQAVSSLGGDFQLTDHQGRIRTNREFQGKFMMVYFGYRYCPDICPTALTNMTEVLNALGPKAKHIQPLFITIDPERDSVKELAEYIINFHDSFLALTGTAEQIEKARSAYKVFAQKVNESNAPDAYVMDHSSIIYVMDRHGKLIAHFNHSTPSVEIVKALRRVL